MDGKSLNSHQRRQHSAGDIPDMFRAEQHLARLSVPAANEKLETQEYWLRISSHFIGAINGLETS